MITTILLSISTVEAFNPIKKVKEMRDQYKAKQTVKNEAKAAHNAKEIAIREETIQRVKNNIKRYEKEIETAQTSAEKESLARKISIAGHMIKRMEGEIKKLK